MRTFKIFSVGFVMALSLLAIPSLACEFNFKVSGDEKPSYKAGDEIVVVVTLALTHRNCPESINNTKFDFTGLKALGATQWKDLGDGKFERKFKLQVIDDPKGKHILNAIRTCDKDGGSGSIKFEVK